MAQDEASPGSIRLPGEFGESARAILSGSQAPAPPRDAATVMLVRGAPAGLEVYMLRRTATMAFAPGAFVFPGGSVDPRDADEKVAWAGPDAAAWGSTFGVPPTVASALVCAAVRETFEESGVMLAGESADSVVADTTSDEWEADRRALLDHSISLAELLGRRKLVLRADLLRPWAHWITPVFEPRRFDTRFFAAALPAGQRTRDVGGEASEVAWVRPADALAAAKRGEIRLFPPTAVTLSELAACADADTALGSQRVIVPLTPQVELRDGAAWLTVPGMPDYLPAGRGMTEGIDGSGSDRVRCVLAPNPSLMTLDGTNTWLIAEPGSASVVVVDPGPDDEAHLQRICAIVAGNGQRVADIVLTHRHSDHSAGAPGLAELTGAPVRAVDPEHRLGSEGLVAGDVLDSGGCEVRVITTPGHTFDSVSLQIPADAVVLTGDTVLGRGTAVIAEDGSLGDYLDSLQRLRALAAQTELRSLLPGHGPLLADPASVLDFYLAHRAERLDEVRAALAAGDHSPAEIVSRVYAAVDQSLWPFAQSSVRAQLSYLRERGEVPAGVTW